MKLMKIFRQAVTALAIMAAIGQSATAPGEERLLQSLRDVRATEAAREATAGCYEFQETRQSTLAAAQPSQQKFIYLVARKPGFVRIASPKTEKGQMVYCENPAYTFVVARKETGPFRLGHYREGTGFGPRVGSNPFNTFVLDYLNVVLPVTGFLGEALGGEPSGSGEVKIERLTRSGPNTIVEFKEQIPLDGGRVSTSTGKAQFDSNFRLVSVEAHGASDFQLARTYNNRHPDGGPFIDFEQSTILQGPAQIVRTFTYRMLDDPVPPDHEFYLAHYGLAEPVGQVMTARPLPLWVWVLAAAGVPIMVYLFYRLARHGGRGGRGAVAPTGRVP